jgi:hypothetical protein
MAKKVNKVLEEAKQLSPLEQLELIRALSEWLQERYLKPNGGISALGKDVIPTSVRRTAPATNLDDYVADFWPDDESVDDFNAYIQQQRAADRLSDQ